jgi:hypothetical protein
MSLILGNYNYSPYIMSNFFQIFLIKCFAIPRDLLLVYINHLLTLFDSVPQ